MSPTAIELCLGRPGFDPELELDVSYVMRKDSLSPSNFVAERIAE